MQKNFKQLYALIARLNKIGNVDITKSDLVNEFTEGRTESAKDMTVREWNNMINTINHRLNEADRKNTQRRRIISNMKSAGYSLDEIYMWVERQKKQTFNSLNEKQLSELIYASEKVKEHFLQKHQ